jgi:hypothetical protein
MEICYKFMLSFLFHRPRLFVMLILYPIVIFWQVLISSFSSTLLVEDLTAIFSDTFEFRSNRSRAFDQYNCTINEYENVQNVDNYRNVEVDNSNVCNNTISELDIIGWRLRCLISSFLWIYVRRDWERTWNSVWKW